MALKISLAGKELGVWDADKLRLRDTFLIKSATGLDLMPIYSGLHTLNPEAVRAVVWWLQRAQNPGLSLEDVDFAWGDLEAVEVEEPIDPPASAEAADSVTSASSETSGSTSSPAG